ncbi:MAG: acetyl-CoA C-acetyltransferase, partial [Marinobacter sp.]|nr:acetyl-CoA C-acetyltransferase [Marinobacter sp.]
MRDVVIVAAKRTAIGGFGGSLSSLRADQLGSAVIKALMSETGIAADQVNEVILGHVLTAGQGQNTARQAAIHGGIPASVPSMTINKVCGSGLKAVHMAVQAIRCGD